jgi:uncharacterized protein (TIGR02996 family)
MQSGAGFLAAIVAHPDDDASRLVYADWLDDHGEPARAELIRVQIALAHLPEDDPRCAAPAERERALLDGPGAGWVGTVRAALPNIGGLTAVLDLALRHGLVEASGRLLTRQFLDHGERLFRDVPLRRVALVGLRGSNDGVAAAMTLAPSLAPDLARSGLLARLPELDLSGSFTLDADLFELAASPNVADLSWLNLRDFGRLGQARRPTWAGVRALASSPHLIRLRALDLSRLRLGPACLEVLAETAHLPRLEELIWEDNRCRDVGLRALAAAPLLRRLTTLRLGSNNLTAAGAEALAGVEAPLALRVLDLGNRPGAPRRNAIGAAGAAALARGPALANAQALALPGNDVGDEGVAALAASPHLPCLRRLDLSHNSVGVGGAWALAATRHLSGLQELDLSGNRLADRAAEALFVLPLPALRRLVLTGNPLGRQAQRRLRDHFGPRVEGLAQ